jgi:CMP-2-keto-3-deoxyoctulosonic acid synthetase
VSSISVEQANDAAQPYCDPKKYSVIVAGDAASVGPALEELGMEIVLTDHDGIALSQPDSQ